MHRFSPYLFSVFLLFFLPAISRADGDALQLGFVKNEGQITDQFYHPNTSVIAAYFSNELDFLIRKDGFSYQLKGVDACPVFASGMEQPVRYHRIDITFEGCNHEPEVKFTKPLPVSENYILQHGTFYNVGRFEAVTLYDVYPGVDVEFVIDPKGEYPVKYNFVLRDVSKMDLIKMQYAGQQDLQLSESKNKKESQVKIATAIGDLYEDIPLSFWLEGDEPRTVEVGYKKLGLDVVGYTLKPGQQIPANKKLIIDPTPQVNWSTYFGGSGIEQASSVKLDGIGYVYLAGNTTSSSGIATSGVHQTVFGGGGANDMFISKFDLSGNRIWTTYLGGTGDDQLSALATDGSSNIYFTGSSSSASGIATAGAHQTVSGGQADVVIGKFNTAGVLQWCSLLGGSQNDIGYGIQFLGADVFVVGSTVSTTNMAFAGAYQTSFGGGAADGFICRFSDAGIFNWSTYFGGNANDILRGIDVDSFGNIVVVGNTASSSGLATAGVHQSTFAGVNDGVIAQFTPTGSKVWCTYFGGSLSDLTMAVAVNSLDEIVVTGYAYSTSGIATSGAYDVTAAGAGDAFVSVFSNVGTRLWGTYFGGSGAEISYAVHIDPVDNIFIIGNTGSASAIATAGAQQTAFGGGLADGFFAQFNTAGTLNWASYLGGSGDDYLRSIDVDVLSGAFAAGFSNSSSGISTSGVFQPSISSAAFDAVLVKYFNLSALPLNIISFSASPAEDAMAVDCQWKVSSDFSCAAYKLERSSDASQWSVVDQINPVGSASQMEYFVRDLNPFQGTIYYRISQLDEAGNSMDSRVAVVALNSDDDYLLLYPVPCADILNISLSNNSEQPCQIDVMDIHGKLLASKNFVLSDGVNYFGVETSSLPAGNYLLRVSYVNGETVVKKFNK